MRCCKLLPDQKNNQLTSLCKVYNHSETCVCCRVRQSLDACYTQLYCRLVESFSVYLQICFNGWSNHTHTSHTHTHMHTYTHTHMQHTPCMHTPHTHHTHTTHTPHSHHAHTMHTHTQVSLALGSQLDLLTTFAELAGVELPNTTLDSFSLVPVLLNQTKRK